MKTYKFIDGEPEEGTLVTGVVYAIGRQGQIHRATGLYPIGYVVKGVPEVFEIGEPEREE